MSDAAGGTGTGARLRVLFALGVTQEFFNMPRPDVPPIVDAIKSAFRDLDSRFGVTVLGTLDDDETMVGAASGWPWTSYILAEAPTREAVAAVCNEVRATTVNDVTSLARFLRIEARIGRPLFFAES